MHRLVSLVAVAALVSGCTPGQLGGGHSEVSTKSVGPELKNCANTTRPEKAIHIEITKMDIENIQANIQELKTTDAYPHGDPGQHMPPPPPENAATTPLDVNLALQEHVSSTAHRNRIYVVFTLDDKTIKFYDNKLALTSLDKNGKKMFCKLSAGDFSDSEAAIVAEYDADDTVTGGKHTHGTININLKVPQVGGGVLPVSIDPDVQNDG